MTQQPGGSPFDRPTPAVGGGETYPSNFQLVGRLLIFWVVGFNPNQKSTLKDKDNNDVYQDVIIAHTAMLDGEPLLGKVDYATRQPKEPFPFPFTAPMEFEGMTWSQTVVVKSLRQNLDTGRPVLARLKYGEQGRNGFTPMKLVDPTPADEQLGMQYLQNRDQIKAYWAQKFAAAGLAKAQTALAAGPFASPGYQAQPHALGMAPGTPAYGPMSQTAYTAPPAAAVPQWQPEAAPAQPAAPVQDQPWNPYNQAPAAQPQVQYPPAPVTEQTEHPTWAPTPDGPPPGWGNPGQ